MLWCGVYKLMTSYPVGFKINAAVANISFNVAGNVTHYTCPANCFAIVNVGGSGTGTITVGGRLVYSRFENAGVTNYDSFLTLDEGAGVSTSPPIFVGPGQSVVGNFTGSFVWSSSVTGVEFTNN